MNSKTRRYFTAKKKAQIVRRHLADKIEISDLANKFEGQPSQPARSQVASGLEERNWFRAAARATQAPARRY